MISVEYDSSGPLKLLVLAAALLFALWLKEISGVLMWFLAAWYGRESHEHYKLAKAYRRLGGHLRRAVSR